MGKEWEFPWLKSIATGLNWSLQRISSAIGFIVLVSPVGALLKREGFFLVSPVGAPLPIRM
jgi:hypothetical protein